MKSPPSPILCDTSAWPFFLSLFSNSLNLELLYPVYRICKPVAFAYFKLSELLSGKLSFDNHYWFDNNNDAVFLEQPHHIKFCINIYVLQVLYSIEFSVQIFCFCYIKVTYFFCVAFGTNNRESIKNSV